MNRDKFKSFIKKIPIFSIVFLILFFLSLVFLIYKDKTNLQSTTPYPPNIIFIGDYKVGEDEWKEYKNNHIPIYKDKDVILKGYFMSVDSNDQSLYPVSKQFNIALYLNHINVKIYDNNGRITELFCEVEEAGESSCGETWQYFTVSTDEYEPMTIVISNPHLYGNANAIDDMLETARLYYPTNFELSILNESRFERLLGFFVMFWGFIIILVSLFSYLFHIKYNKSILSTGFAVLFGGVYIFFCSRSISIYFSNMLNNTIIVFLAGMFYYLFLNRATGTVLCQKKKIFGHLATINSVIFILLSIILTLTTDLYFFDLWFFWAIFQGISFILIFIGIGFSIKEYSKTRKIIFSTFLVAFVTYVLDTLFCGIGGFEETGFSQSTFIIIFSIAFITILRYVPKSVNNALKARELETEKMNLNNKLQESRILLMISQIQPHFLYNMLNTIYHLCDRDIETAKYAIDNFSSYLRNNIDSLSTKELIPFEVELEHIKTYVDLEKIRFGEELEIIYDIKTKDFNLPILSIQPLVENAIKHGVSKKRGGGKVIISSEEDESSYIITVLDTGVGYDVNKDIDDGRSHIGLENVRNRLQNKVDGELSIHSEIGIGTKSTVCIPKKEIK